LITIIFFLIFTVRIQFIVQENVEHLRMIILLDTDVTWLKKNRISCFCILNNPDATTMTRLKIVIWSIPTLNILTRTSTWIIISLILDAIIFIPTYNFWI
jgi:hypothetical protein